MGPAEMSRLVYRGLYLAMNALVVRPGAVFFVILLSGMMIAKTGPVGLSESTLLWMQDLYRGRPAEAGYLNIERCADDAGTQAQEPVERSQTPLATVECKRQEVTTVSIEEAAKELGQMLVWAYALALVIGNVISLFTVGLERHERTKGRKDERTQRERREGLS